MQETSETLHLPVLRDDLQLLDGPVSADGSPTWTIYDPLRGRYFRIGWAAFQMLSYWSVRVASQLLEQIHRHTTCRLGEHEVREFVRFLFANNLTVEPVGADYQAYAHQYRASLLPWYQQWLHNYLFFRIPLLRPDRFLRQTLKYLQWCFDIRLLTILIASGVLAIYLVSRQWDRFFATFLHFFDWQGALLYGFALLFSKVFHELGHAYTAVRYGCRVPVIGMAFMALFPMPYTDVTDAWRLPLRQQRLAIGAAGIITELAIAVLATLAWSFLPDGPLRSAAFILSTSVWITTLTINLSPFMRFDGYYMLSDAWGIDNLQPRSFALARWQIRQWLGISLPKPESLPVSLQRKMVIYAYITWIYRLVVFTGLALMVYHLFFKVLGLFLFAVEIIWFILRPIINEIREWKKMGAQQLSSRRKWRNTVSLLFFLLLMLIPWSTAVRMPALLEAEKHTVLYAPEVGRIENVLAVAGQQVKAGQILLQLHSPKLDDEINLSEKRLEYFRLRLERSATTREASSEMRVTMQQWSAESARLAGFKKQRERLVIRAPFAGVVVDLAQNLHAKRWVNPELALATLVSPGQEIVQGLASEDSVMALSVGQTGRFIPEDVLSKSVDVKVEAIDDINLHEFDRPYLASVYGGAIASRTTQKGQLSPAASVFAVRMTPYSEVPLTHVQRGVAVINARPRSFARRLFDNAASLLLRESGF